MISDQTRQDRMRLARIERLLEEIEYQLKRINKKLNTKAVDKYGREIAVRGDFDETGR